MPLLLNVPYSEKEEAKNLGAFWNPSLKKWYAPDKKNYKKFSKWISDKPYYTILCDYFYIVEGVRECFKCHKPTHVIGFGIEDYYTIEQDSAEENGLYVSSSIGNNEIHIAAHIEPLPATIENYVTSNWNYKKRYSRTTHSAYLANCCEHCDVLQGDFPLFSEVDSPFFIENAEAASKLTLYKIPLEYDLVVDYVEMSFSPTDYLIKQHAKLVDGVKF